MTYSLRSLILATALATQQVDAFPEGQRWRYGRQAPAPCQPVHYMIARGSTEPAGSPGLIGSVLNASQPSFPNSDVENIDYPATLTDYASSSGNGTQAVSRQLTAFVQRCPDSKIAMLGYSQGAHIIGDSLCGGGGPNIAAVSAPLDPSISSHVTAIIQFGDPRFIPNQAFDTGNATTQGIFPRQSFQLCSAFNNVLQSYCDETDLFCASGNSLETHLGYFAKYSTVAAEFINQKLGAGAATGSVGSSTVAAAAGGPTATQAPAVCGARERAKPTSAESLTETKYKMMKEMVRAPHLWLGRLL